MATPNLEPIGPIAQQVLTDLRAANARLEQQIAELWPLLTQQCRDCGREFQFDPDADRCPECVAEMLG